MIIRKLGMQPYLTVWEDMKSFTTQRDTMTEDEVWVLEHPPVYTQGQAGKAEHILNPKSIPVVQSDRGGQVTYHGPGQLVSYVLMDLHRLNIGIRTLVCKLENVLISVLEENKIAAQTKCGAPGVYVDEKKIASIGLRVKNGRTYHGIALNVNMDLTPFSGINPCGFQQLEMTQIADFNPAVEMKEITEQWIHHFSSCFGK